MLLLLLSRFSHVWLYATPEMAAHQAPPSLGFSRQEHWSGFPFPSPMHESESEVAQSCLTPSNPMDCSLPGSSIHGIFQARVLEWRAIAFPQTTNIRELWQKEWWSKIKPKPVHNHIWAQIHMSLKKLQNDQFFLSPSWHEWLWVLKC